MIIADSAGLTDTGRRRQANEDSFCIDGNIGLYVVADGMGGHAAGEVASRIAVQTLHNYLLQVQHAKTPEELPDTNSALSREANQLLAAIHLSNKSVYDLSQTRPTYAGMGTTVSAVMFRDNSAITANVGDSPVFLIRNGLAERISALHTVESELGGKQENGAKLGPEFKHMLTRAVGTKPGVSADVIETKMQVGDILVISSDGLTDKVNAPEIQEITDGKAPDAACRALVDLANERGGEDNITVIVIRIKKIYTSPWITAILRRVSRYLRPKPVIRHPQG
ncbi:PP2C family protein-serine/threonine phosphatase [Desulfosudis oleivorans]|uniref:Protein serine/threonine phosphatase n=1 Tax=Desulfosudis oleivorans (strain DSM 6200 / JCM 39069 / Hxd3) TaxID=96561 RepID=A8ZYR5_DESOH|nr:protein phosphatase 2C domain-containing protein [Desulfosudis oleivorans]ABW67170.1 protein serine/threonine phosphatase [Desulfosudis oleivorans Hxd3]